MKIYGFEVIGKCLYSREFGILVVGDLHLGYEDSLLQRGTAVPRSQLKETLQALEEIFQKTGNVSKIILLGDVKHYFGKILRQEWDDVGVLLRFLSSFLKKEGKIIITSGNHDNILLPIIKKYSSVEIVTKFTSNGILFIHGDKRSMRMSCGDIKNRGIKLIICGHFHPAYILKDKNSVKREKYKCFLYGYSREYKKKIIYMPSFFPLIEGSDVVEDLGLYNKKMSLVLISDEGKAYSFKKIRT